MLGFQGVFFPGENLNSDSEDRMLKKSLFYFDKIYAIIPEHFNGFIFYNCDLDARFFPVKLIQFGNQDNRYERITNFISATKPLIEQGFLELIRPDENIFSKPYYWGLGGPAIWCIKQKYEELRNTKIKLTDIVNYIPHFLYGNMIEDLKDAEFRDIVKQNFDFDKVDMFQGQAQQNWAATIGGDTGYPEDDIENIEAEPFFSYLISPPMWASLILNHALMSSFRRKAITVCANTVFQSLLNRKVERSYNKFSEIDKELPNFRKDFASFQLVIDNLPDFELKSFEDILEMRERLKDEMLEFRHKMNELVETITIEPYSETFANHLEIIKRGKIQPIISDMRKKLSYLDKKTIPKIISATALNLYLCINPSLPPALAILACPDILSLTKIWQNYKKEYKEIMEKNGFSLLLKIENC